MIPLRSEKSLNVVVIRINGIRNSRSCLVIHANSHAVLSSNLRDLTELQYGQRKFYLGSMGIRTLALFWPQHRSVGFYSPTREMPTKKKSNIATPQHRNTANPTVSLIGIR